MLDTPEDDERGKANRPTGDVLREYVPHPYQALTGAGKIQAVNDAWLERLGYDRNTVSGDRFIEYLTPESRTEFESIFREFRSAGTISGVEIGVVHADGHAIRARMDGRVEYDEQGEVHRFHCQFVDSEREQEPRRNYHEREATVTEESLKLAIEGAQIGVWDWDMETDEVHRDELLTNMLGYSPSEMGDQLSDWERLVHPEGEKRHNEALKQHLENQTQYYECDYRMKTKSGDWKWVRTMGTVVERDDDGTPIRAVGIHQDIDEQKRNHRKLARKSDQLEALNRVVRHDIRDQMSVVHGWAQELEHHLDDNGKVALEYVLEASQDVIDLTEVVRDIVKSLDSDGERALEPIELTPCFEDVLETKREVYPNAEFTVSGELPSVSVLANEMLSSVFRNLLVNAVEHNDAGTPEVTLETDVREDSVVVRVADNGPGIAAGSMDDIFGRGEKGIESTGTGIGLYLVHSLVTEYGGDVWVENRTASGNEESEGAVFAVELPRAE